jgi:hypothetical protein
VPAEPTQALAPQGSDRRHGVRVDDRPVAGLDLPAAGLERERQRKVLDQGFLVPRFPFGQRRRPEDHAGARKHRDLALPEVADVVIAHVLHRLKKAHDSGRFLREKAGAHAAQLGVGLELSNGLLDETLVELGVGVHLEHVVVPAADVLEPLVERSGLTSGVPDGLDHLDTLVGASDRDRPVGAVVRDHDDPVDGPRLAEQGFDRRSDVLLLVVGGHNGNELPFRELGPQTAVRRGRNLHP